MPIDARSSASCMHRCAILGAMTVESVAAMTHVTVIRVALEVIC
jgi:hypothetical protein